MRRWIWEISASSWFYYKDICYDARSHERKKCDTFIQDPNVSMHLVVRNVFYALCPGFGWTDGRSPSAVAAV